MPFFTFRVRVAEVRWVEQTFVSQADSYSSARSRLDKVLARAKDKRPEKVKDIHVRPVDQEWGEIFALPDPARPDATVDIQIRVMDVPKTD